MNDSISIHGARTNNLKNIDVEIPRHKLVVITGLSGSGKSSLAFDTIYAEGQRRYMESLNSYAKQYVDLMDKPDVDSITGLTPTIAIDQKISTANPRSTVGTCTEIYDLLRLLFSRIGAPHCPHCRQPLVKKTFENIIKDIAKTKKELIILAPLVRDEKLNKDIIKNIARAGFTHVRLDDQSYNLEEKELPDDNKNHTLEIIITQVIGTEDNKLQISKGVKKALDLSNGLIKVLIKDNGGWREKIYSQILTCLDCNFSIPDIEPRHFSFNSPFGACPKCHGLGVTQILDSTNILNKKLSINEGAIRPWPKNNNQYNTSLRELEDMAQKHKFTLDTPVKDLTAKQLKLILHENAHFTGIISILEKRYQETESTAIKQELEQYMKIMSCPACQGQRLKPEYLAVKIFDYNIAQLSEPSIDEAIKEYKNIIKKLKNSQKKVAEPIVKEIISRLSSLQIAGLNYISINRPLNTLSGGEAQRVKLATQLSSNLVNVTYVLDEPSVGLHSKDMQKLISALKRLRDLENTVIVVEHDEVTMLEADYIIDIGPGAGSYGGQIIAEGTPVQIKNNAKSLTGQYLSKKKMISGPLKYRKGNGQKIKIIGASQNNLKNIDIEIPLGKFIAFTGVSGSGKSTLITDILSKALNKKFYRAKEEPGQHKKIEGLEYIDKVITIDQSPIGRTPRSNPATYTGAFTYIRELYAEQTEAKLKNLTPGHFSFNVVGGRCEVCGGDGYQQIDMQFLSDVYIKCPSCRGQRYQKEILEVYYTLPFNSQESKNIADILALTVLEAKEFFKHHDNILQKLNILDEVGLGYIKLGQPATKLSGGEAQRVKLATELSRRDTGKTLYILDEPTTGLHLDDISKLLKILNKLVDKGNTVLIIEHNLDVIKSVDHIIDLGPEGGDKGGEIVAQGTPDEVAKNKKSYTGMYLKKTLSTKNT